MITSQSEHFPGPRHEIAGIPVRELARQFGTPFFVYAAAAIVRRIEDLRALDVIRYAQKACSNLAILDQLGRRAPGRDITLRIKLGCGHGHSQKTNTGGDHSKHGIWHEQLPEVLALAARHGLRVTGLHMQIGSGTDLEHLSRLCGAIERCARQIGPSISTISAGGGLPIAYRPDDPRVLGIVGEKLSSHPGTALSAAATNVLLYFSTISSKVGSPRRTHDEHLASESRSRPSFVRRSRCWMSVETSPGW
jgi:diaminopimelate decarboxylase